MRAKRLGMASHSIVVEPGAPEADSRAVRVGLYEYNKAATGLAIHSFGAYLRDGEGQVSGGVLGRIWDNWLFVATVWIADELRGRGYGRELMLQVETYAKERGCRHAHLDTFSYQARPLYEKLGYTLFGQLDDYPQGHTKYFMKKELG